jgi:putative ABC transport system substrate-binding protein
MRAISARACVASAGVLSGCRSLALPGSWRMPRIAFVWPGPRSARAEVIDGFLAGLRDLGYVEDRTITIEWRFIDDGDPRRQAQVTAIAAEVARLPVDVIVAGTNSVALAAQQATSTTPIVAANVAYPIEMGLVAGLAKPGAGNLTAESVTSPGLPIKELDLLRDLVPGLAKVVALVNVTTPVYDRVAWHDLRAAADEAGVTIARVDLSSPDDLEDLGSPHVLRRKLRRHCPPSGSLCG